MQYRSDEENLCTPSVFIANSGPSQRLSIFSARLRALRVSAGPRATRLDSIPGIATTTIYYTLQGARLLSAKKLDLVVQAWGGNSHEFVHLWHWAKEGRAADLDYLDLEGPHWNSDADRWEPCPWNHQITDHTPFTPAPSRRRRYEKHAGWPVDPLDKEEVAHKLAAEYEAGASIRNLVKAYDISYSTVRNALLSVGVTLRPPK